MEAIAENTAVNAGTNGERKRSDRDLQTARRLDWRYLLPDPRLHEVAYVGRPEGTLLEALEQFSKAVTVVRRETASGEGVPGEFDVVVLRSRERSEVELASSVLQAGGYLYWEVAGVRRGPSRRSCVAWLKQLGYDQIELNWNRPSFENCLEIIPLGEPSAATFVLSRRYGGVRRRMVQLVGRVLAKLGMLKWLMPCQSIVARKRAPAEQSMNAMETVVRRNWERLELGEDGPPNGLTSIVATPAYRASRHAVFMIFTKGSPEPRLVAKTPRLTDETSSLDREVANLRALHAIRPGGFDSAPRVLAYEAQWGSQLLLETAVVGYTMRPAVVRRRPKECGEAGIRWLVEVHQASAQRRHDPRGAIERLVNGPLNYFERVFPVTNEEKELIAETRRLVKPLESIEIPLVFEHGDFSAPNILMGEDGEIGVVDWELAEPQGLPAVDLFFFISYLAFARSRAEKVEEYLDAFRGAFFGPEAWAPQYVARYQERLRLPAASLKPLFIACWSRYVSNFLARLNELGAGPRAKPEEETAEWLRNNRYFSLWRYAVKHGDQLRLAE